MFRAIRRHFLSAILLALATHASAATAVDPTTTGSFGAKSGIYKFAAKIDNLVTQFAKTEIWAEVWYPTGNVAGKKFPIVVLLHGNHGTCGTPVTGSDGKTYRVDDDTSYSTTGTCPSGYVVTPNHLGYDYVAKRLATNGFVVVSINANRGITAHPEDSHENDPGLIQRRGRMILRHLQLLGQWNASGGGPSSVGFNFQGKLDFSKITLFGHSRGGDGIIAAYNLLKNSSAWRSRLPAASKIVALASMAPTDFQTSHPAARGTALGVLLPMCDGDVNRLSGIGFYDRSIQAIDTAGNFKSVLEVWRTNHNGYNTQWQTDDSYQAADHTCPGQGNRLFKFAIGFSPEQQSIGRYFLMGLARAKSQGANFGQLFNPAFALPANLKSLTRIDRGYFVGTGAAAKRIVRFDFNKCGSTFLVTSNVLGTCFSPANPTVAEHDPSTWVGRVRWPKANPRVPNNFVLFTLNGGTPINLSTYKTLDMRVGPDCFLTITSSPSFKGCTDVSPYGGSANWPNIRIYLQDSSDHLSTGISPAAYLAPPETIAVSVPDGGGGSFLPADPLGHAILSSLRIPLTAFQKSGFNLAAAKYVRVALGGNTSNGGFYFGDVWAVGAVPTALSADGEAPEPVASASDLGIEPVATAIEPASADVSLHPATPAGADFADATIVQGVAAAQPAAADRGLKIVAVKHSRLPVAIGASADSVPDTTPMGTAPTVEFTLSTPKPLADTSDSGFSVVIGGHMVKARYFATGLENASPSVTKLVVPAEAVDAAADGAPLAVVSATKTWHFGPLAKSSIR